MAGKDVVGCSENASWRRCSSVTNGMARRGMSEKKSVGRVTPRESRRGAVAFEREAI